MQKRGARELGARAGYALVGVAIIGLGASILQVGGVGVDPYTAMNIGISDRLGWSLGPYQLLSNLVLFIPMLIWGRQYIGLGSVINMVLTGFFIDGFTALLTPILPAEPTILTTIGCFVAGILVFAFGASAYMSAGLGTAPWDGIAPMIVDHTGWRYRLVRVPQDLIGVVVAVVFHGPVGLGTAMTAFFTGPLIEFFMKKVHRPAVARLAGRAQRAAGEQADDTADRMDTVDES